MSEENNETLQSARDRIKATGRNEPCPCGSGQKYKLCCLATDEEIVNKLGVHGRPSSINHAMRIDMSGFFEWLVENGRGVVLEGRKQNLELLYLFHLHSQYLGEARQEALRQQEEAMSDPKRLEQMRAKHLQRLEQIDRKIVEARKQQKDGAPEAELVEDEKE
jgi:hypothetical protein